jgi:hypothetical protein
MVDAPESQYAPSCFPGTREQYIQDITQWATASDEPIFWMRGPVRVGKSAIAQTWAEKEAGYLGAAFFFSISGRKDPSRFFTSLTYQLSTEFQHYRAILNTKISNNQTLVKKRLSSQFKALLVEPLIELERQGKGLGRRVIFVDGLDECSSENAQCEIIGIIAAPESIHPKSTPFRWAMFCRPEVHIESIFDKENISPICCGGLLSISCKLTERLNCTFKTILQRRKLLSKASSWPTDQDIRTLVEASASLLAYPAAVLRFVGNRSSLRLEGALRDVLDLWVILPTKLPHSPD